MKRVVQLGWRSIHGRHLINRRISCSKTSTLGAAPKWHLHGGCSGSNNTPIDLSIASNHARRFHSNDANTNARGTDNVNTSKISQQQANNEHEKEHEHGNAGSASLYRRIRIFLGRPVGQSPPKQLSFECEYFIREACKLQTAKGFQHAHDLLNRLIEEKNYANDLCLKQRHTNGGGVGGIGFGGVGGSNVLSTSQFIVQDNFFHIIMFGWARSKRKEGPAKIEALLTQMAQQYDIDMATKDLFFSSAAANISSSSRGVDDGGAMMGWIDKREKRVTCMPSTASYNILLTALANASRSDHKNAMRAERVMGTMWKLHQEKQWHTKPNTRTYEIVIEAYKNCNTFKSGTNAKRMFDQMVSAHEKDLATYRLNSLSGLDYNWNDEDQNYRQIIKPTTRAAKDVASAYIDARGTVQSAEVFLKDCISFNESSGGLLRNVSFENLLHVVLKAYENVARTARHPKARFEAAQHAERLLLLTAKFRGSGNGSRNDKGNDKTRQFAILKPSTQSFNVCLNAWAQSDVKESSRRADSLFVRMMKNYNYVTPDLTTFHTVMTAFSRSFPYDPESALKTESMIRKMYKMNESGKYHTDNSNIKPTSMTYAIAIEAWAKSKKLRDNNNDDDESGVHKSSHARRLLDELLRRHTSGEANMAPNIHAYTSVLKACTFTSPKDNKNNNDVDDDENTKKELLTTAINTYEEVRNDDGMTVTADKFFYATMIRAICHLLPEDSRERLPLLGRVYNDARRESKVSEEIRRSCTDSEVAHLLRQAKRQ